MSNPQSSSLSGFKTTLKNMGMGIQVSGRGIFAYFVFLNRKRFKKLSELSDIQASKNHFKEVLMANRAVLVGVNKYKMANSD